MRRPPSNDLRQARAEARAVLQGSEHRFRLLVCALLRVEGGGEAVQDLADIPRSEALHAFYMLQGQSFFILCYLTKMQTCILTIPDILTR